MATQAKITLTALGGVTNLPERTLTLHPHFRTIKVGRASKTPSKGLQAAVDNAWFDSPVMSRNHAEIVLDAEKQVLTIKDIGSMHGTFVNSSPLRQLEPHGLNNNDLVVFGAEVKRNIEVFPACSFKVNYEFLPFKPSISYAAPETDDEDYEVSNDEDNEVPSSEDGVSIESPPHKVSQAVNAIDLTRDDSPAESELEGTGETAVERNIKKTVTGQPADVDYNTDSVSNGPYTGNQPILVDSEDEAAQDPSDSDNHSEVQSAGDASSQADSMDEQESECEIESDYEMDVDAEAQPIDFAGRNSEPASVFTQLGSSLMDMPIPESNLRTTIDPADHLEEEDDDDGESEFGLSDAAAEGIRALFEIGSIDNVADSHFKVDEEIDSHSVVACGVLKADDEIESPKRVTFTCPPPEQVTEMGSGYSHLSSVGQPQTEIPLNQPIMNLRQPSPSDAAMVKTTIPFSDPLVITANPIKVHHLPSQDFQKLTAQCLGEKTGKHAFFAAREDNRAKIYGRRDNYSGENSSLQTVKTCLSSVMEEKRERSRIAMEKFKEKKRQIEEEINSKLLQSSQTFPTLPTTRVANSLTSSFLGLSYLDDHTQGPKAIRPFGPEFDMTSAVTYNESKASMASASKHSSNPSGRVGLSINDIIDGAAGDQSCNTLKRKAGDISEAIENDVQVWASSPFAANGLVTSTATAESRLQHTNRREQSENAPAPLAAVSEHRPAKRLRKLVESVGYVALGGAALFGALVLSAPEFL